MWRLAHDNFRLLWLWNAYNGVCGFGMPSAGCYVVSVLTLLSVPRGFPHLQLGWAIADRTDASNILFLCVFDLLPWCILSVNVHQPPLHSFPVRLRLSASTFLRPLQFPPSISPFRSIHFLVNLRLFHLTSCPSIRLSICESSSVCSNPYATLSHTLPPTFAASPPRAVGPPPP